MCVRSNLLGLVILRDTCLHIREKGHTNVAFVTSNLLRLALLRDTCIHILARGHTDVMCVRMHLLHVTLLKHTCLYMDKGHTNVCLKRFATHGKANRHVLTHTGEKPHKCDVCQKQFATRAHFNRHMRFTRSGHLNAHTFTQ